MPKDDETVTMSALRQMFAENNALILKRFDTVDAQFAQVHAQFRSIDEQFVEVHAQFRSIDAQFVEVNAQFKKIDAQFVAVHTEFARAHRDIGTLRDDVVDVLDRSIVPQLEEHRRDIALLKRVVVPT